MDPRFSEKTGGPKWAFQNRRAGILIGQGKTMQEAMDEVHMVVEGVYSAKAARRLAEKYDVPMPIVDQVNEVLFEGKPAAEAVQELMLRDKTKEANTLTWYNNNLLYLKSVDI